MDNLSGVRSSAQENVPENKRDSENKALTKCRQWKAACSDFSFDSNKFERSDIWCFVQKLFCHKLEVKMTDEEIKKHVAVCVREELLGTQLKKEDEEIKLTNEDTCECGIAEHPSIWSDYMVNEIHRNLYLIKHKELEISDDILLAEFNDIKFLRVLMNSRTPWTEKIEEFLIFVDIELGFEEGLKYQPFNRQVYLALNKTVIIGCVVVEPIRNGYTMHLPLNSQPMVESLVPAYLGVNRLWVFAKYRRQRYASTLLDFARNHFVTEHVVMKDNIAFAEPNILGRYFAVSYCGTSHILVY